MLKLFKSQRYKKKSELKKSFFSETGHSWISFDKYLKSSLEEFLDKCSLEMLNKVISACGDLKLIKQDDFTSVAYHGELKVMCSERFVKELRSFNPSAAHGELAFLISRQFVLAKNLEYKDELELDVLTDEFAVKLGFANDIEYYLQSREESIEKRVRLVYLSSNTLTWDN